MEFRVLKYFLMVARLGNMTRAAGGGDGGAHGKNGGRAFLP